MRYQRPKPVTNNSDEGLVVVLFAILAAFFIALAISIKLFFIAVFLWAILLGAAVIGSNGKENCSVDPFLIPSYHCDSN